LKNIYSAIRFSRFSATSINKALEEIDNQKRAMQEENPAGSFLFHNRNSISCIRNGINRNGYYTCLKFIRDQYQTLSFTIDLSHEIHSTIFQDVIKNKELVGCFKTKNNSIRLGFSNGCIMSNFITVPPHSVRYEMQKLFSWVTAKLQEKSIHPLILAALFKYQFVSIHPYPEGNGKMSRLFTTLILLKAGYDVFKKTELDQVIEPLKDQYIKTLCACQFYRPKKDVELENWILFFLSLIEKAYFLHSFNTLYPYASVIIPSD
jgi:Fic family protein